MTSGGTAHRRVQGIVAQNFEFERVFIRHLVQRATIGIGNVLGGDQYRFQQLVDVALFRQRDADAEQLLLAGKQIVGNSRGMWLIHFKINKPSGIRIPVNQFHRGCGLRLYPACTQKG
jgi:hypothetical protein